MIWFKRSCQGELSKSGFSRFREFFCLWWFIFQSLLPNHEGVVWHSGEGCLRAALLGERRALLRTTRCRWRRASVCGEAPKPLSMFLELTWRPSVQAVPPSAVCVSARGPKVHAIFCLPRLSASSSGFQFPEDPLNQWSRFLQTLQVLRDRVWRHLPYNMAAGQQFQKHPRCTESLGKTVRRCWP